ncbi:MAG TPA: DMT family transporter, partial [Egibacteraceae bacterium]|nr:DMT family transporter [Egibacteraceae bacterium]
MSAPPAPAARTWSERTLTVGLVAVTAAWGSTFVMVKDAVERVPPLTFNAARFTVATIALGAFCVPALRRLGREGLIHGGILGVALFAGYAFQTVGLRHIEATVAGFITGMFVVFTPVLSALLLRRRPGPFALMGVVLATGGMALLSLPAQPAGRAAGGFALSFGVMLMLACALSFAAQIVGLGAWAAR